jgi:hypothetical protein
MIRINPSIVVASPRISHYNTKMYYRNMKYDLTKVYSNLDIHSDSLDINNIQTPESIRTNLINYLNYTGKQQHNCFHFARSIVNSNKYKVKYLLISQLDYLQLFDKIGLVSYVTKNIVEQNHEAIYIGKHYNEHLFMSKLGKWGIYMMTLDQLQKVYDSFRFSIMVYTPTNLLNFKDHQYDGNIRRDHNFDNEKLE